MGTEELFRIWDRFDRSDCVEICYENEKEKIVLRKNTGVAAQNQLSRPAAGNDAAMGYASEKGAGIRNEPFNNADSENMPARGTVIKAPLVGTFYRSSAPGGEPFVKPGQMVKKGDTLAIIEAMKMMNEINAPCDGTVLEILADNETLVEYDQELMILGEENV